MSENDQKKYSQEIFSAFADRTVKRLWIIIMIQCLIIAGMVAYYVWHESQFEYEITETYTSESDDGGIAIVNRDGEVHYGEGYIYPNQKENP